MIIYHGRFQPFHLGHKAAVDYLLQNFNEPIVVGVINPAPDSLFDGDDKDWLRFAKDRNPFNFWERYCFFSNTYKKEISEGKIAGIVPLPRPSVNVNKANHFIPPQPRKIAVFERWGDEIEDWKKQKYIMNGEDVLEIPFKIIPEAFRGVSGSLIRCLIALDIKKWSKLVPDEVNKYISDSHLDKKIRQAFTDETAERLLTSLITGNTHVQETLQKLNVIPQKEINTYQKRDIKRKVGQKPSKEILSVVHLTDLHIGQGTKKYQWNSQEVLDAVINDIQNVQRSENITIRAIFISGDISFSGKEDQYAEISEWLKKLTEKVGLTTDDVFIVPGNHDVDRETSRYLKDLGKNARKELDTVLADTKSRKLLLAKFDAFFDFVKQFGLPNQTAGWPSFEQPFWAHQIQVDDSQKVNIIGLNSCLCSDDEDRIGNLKMGSEQLSLFRSLKDNDINIAISHHPSSWCDDSQNIETYIRKYCDLWFYGHIHKSEVEEGVSKVSGQIIKISGRATHVPEGNMRTNGYNIISILKNPNSIVIRVYPRRWRDRSLDFIEDNDFDLIKNSTYIENEIK